MQVAYRVDEGTGAMTCVHESKEVAEENIRRMKSLLEIPRVRALIASNSSRVNSRSILTYTALTKAEY